MKKLVIIKTGSTLPGIQARYGDFEQWMVAASGLTEDQAMTINVQAGQALPNLQEVSGIIITGSPAMLTDQEAWMLRLQAWLPQVLMQAIPVLGICFGHQILAQAMGGQVAYHPQGREIGTVAIELTADGQQDPLLSFLPPAFFAHTTHAQTVLELPEHAVLLASNAFEPHHAFRLGDRAWGLQFHPEFSTDIMSAYISELAESLSGQGQDVATLQASITKTNAVNLLLKRFVALL